MLPHSGNTTISVERLSNDLERRVRLILHPFCPQLPKALALIPRHCLELFCQCAAYGQPALGIPTASGEHHRWGRAGLGWVGKHVLAWIEESSAPVHRKPELGFA